MLEIILAFEISKWSIEIDKVYESIKEKVQRLETTKTCPSDDIFWGSYQNDFEKLYTLHRDILEDSYKSYRTDIPLFQSMTIQKQIEKVESEFGKLQNLISQYCENFGILRQQPSICYCCIGDDGKPRSVCSGCGCQCNGCTCVSYGCRATPNKTSSPQTQHLKSPSTISIEIQGSQVMINAPNKFDIYTASGRRIITDANSGTFNLKRGVYILKTKEGSSTLFMVP